MNNTKTIQKVQNKYTQQNSKLNTQQKTVLKQEHKNLPEKRFKAGAISSTIWKNSNLNKKGELVEFKTVSIQRSYLDKNNVWQHTQSLRAIDLPKVQLVLAKAYEYLVLTDFNDAKNEGDLL